MNDDCLVFVDTETTGMMDYKSPPSARHQPRIVQLSAILASADGKQLDVFDVLIKPDGWSISLGAQKVHGITMKRCLDAGVPVREALAKLENFCVSGCLFISHNADFDRRMLVIEDHHRSRNVDVQVGTWGKKPWYCTMREATDICCLPGRYGKYKWPTLSEAHQHFFRRDFDGAHGGAADTAACMRVYFAMNKPKR